MLGTGIIALMAGVFITAGAVVGSGNRLAPVSYFEATVEGGMERRIP